MIELAAGDHSVGDESENIERHRLGRPKERRHDRSCIREFSGVGAPRTRMSRLVP